MKTFFIPKNTRILEMSVCEPSMLAKIERVHKPEKKFLGFTIQKERSFLSTDFYNAKDKEWQTYEEAFNFCKRSYSEHIFLTAKHEIWYCGRVRVIFEGADPKIFYFQNDEEKNKIIQSLSKLTTFVEITSSGIN